MLVIMNGDQNMHAVDCKAGHVEQCGGAGVLH